MNPNYTRDDEKKVTFIAANIKTEEKLLEYEKTLADENKSMDERLKAYCIVFTYYRRKKETNKCIDLYENYRNSFNGDFIFIFIHFYSIAIKETGRRKDLVRSIDLARKSLLIQPHHTGALNNLAESLCCLAEEDGVKKTSSKQLLNEASGYVQEAIDLERDYPKFYSTKAVILSGLGDHKNALKEISKAINMEDSRSFDYTLRISDYVVKKMKIDLRWSIDSVTKKSRRELGDAMDEARKSNLQILSLFVAITSFVIAGINISVNFSLEDAVQLIFVLSSATLMTISGFTLLYDSQKGLWRFARAFGIGLLMLIIAFI